MQQLKIFFQFIILAVFQLLTLHVFFQRIEELEQPRKIPHMLTMFLPSLDKKKNVYSESGFLKSIRHKSIIHINLTGEIKEDDKIFEIIQLEARRLMYTRDTTHIIKVRFCDENTYGQFIQLVNMMVEDRHKRYAFINDDFYILGGNP
ncbi:hypothetical protein [Foetidibacter luteolus]|uniref:hypothetical protein n=1 Tax=Foetidibacter luteolus TaxID=2608880 RepID=UPI00129A6AB8|nr:hypothetical protein [Foetidibacter luteolus]